MILYRKDPIFNNLERQGKYSAVLFHTFIKNKKVYTVWADGIEYNQLEFFKKNKTLLLTNSKFNNVDEFESNIHTVNESYYGSMYHNYEVNPYTTINRQFNCFSNRFDVFRQTWFYHLIRRKWLDLGYVSFNCDLTHSQPSGYRGLTSSEIFEASFLDYNQNFAHEHQQIKNKIPYKNFTDDGDLTGLILSSNISIILETWFSGNHCVTFSEKTMRCLQLPRPWVLFSVKGAVQQLRQWGFDVLDDVVDHSVYDNIDNSVERQVKILDLLEDLIVLNIPVERCIQASEHNKSVLKSWSDSWFDNMHKDFEIVHKKILTL